MPQGGGFSAPHPVPFSEGLTLRYSTGLVTLNLSIVVMMIAGVVRKKRRMKRTTLITRQRIHQMKPRMERCSLGGVRGEEGIRNSHTEPHTRSQHSPACISRAWGMKPSFPLLSQGPTLAQPGKNNSFSYQSVRVHPFPITGDPKNPTAAHQ